MSGEFDISVERTCHRVLLRVSGLLDAYTGELLRATIAEQVAQDVTHVELDASGITFIDSGGLRVLADTNSDLEERGGRLAVVDPSETVVQILRLTDLTSHFGL